MICFKKTTHAFTLVELSIVLVILGLLIGGVLTGQSLIRAAELRSVSTQYSRYVTAVQTFRDKYFALPGDMTNATSYWGIAGGSGNDSTCAGTSSSGTATCNGNGDGQILTATPGTAEIFRFWQHLANAGLIEGSYVGIQQGAAFNATTTANAPAGKTSSSLWSASNYGAMSGNANAFDGQYDNALGFGGVISNSAPFNPIFKPEDAYNVDVKLDDGKPATGKVVVRTNASWGATATSCTDAAASTSLTANYNLANTALSCALFFRQAF